jgi:SAM-dependent methyltransferase
MTSATYVGNELDLFAAATCWKSYVRHLLRPYLGTNVLEVGAGFGGTTRHISRRHRGRWVCLEPDTALAERLTVSIRAGKLPAGCDAVTGTIDSLADVAEFDSILYVDVLEHIQDDAGELARAAAHLRDCGWLVVLAPAHAWLYSPFDRAVGHYRRYTKASLRAIVPDGLDLVRVDYLDAVGLLASLGNRLILKSGMPTPAQIAVWDKVMVPLSRIADPLVRHSCGKSVLGVWRKRDRRRQSHLG